MTPSSSTSLTSERPCSSPAACCSPSSRRCSSKRNDIVKINDKIRALATKEDLKKVMDNFIDPDTYKHFLLMNGDKIEADVAYTKLYKSAKKSIYVIDNYIGLKTLELLRAAKDSVEVIIFSNNVRNKDMLTKNLLNDFIRDYPDINLKMKVAGRKYHDRYIAIDYGTENEVFYLCGDGKLPSFFIKSHSLSDERNETAFVQLVFL